MADPLADLAQLPGVPSAVAAATAAVDVVLRDRGLRAVPGAVRAEALRAGAEANAALTGAPDRWRPGALRLASELAELAGLVRVAPGQALARAHAVAARGVEPDEALGRVAESSAAARLRGVGDLLAGTTSAPALVLAAVVHAELATVAPFRTASGLVARAVEHAVLVASGLDPYAVIVVEAGHAADPAGYRAALAAYADGGVRGVGAWLTWCAGAVTRGAEVSPVAAGARARRP